MMTLKMIMSWLDNGHLCGDDTLSIKRVNTDTRTLRSGDLFVALQGEHFDGNNFLHQAKLAGATAAIANRGLEAVDLDGIQVADTKYALGRIAAGWRSQFKLPLVAVTGSNGKTTVTQMLASIMREYKGEASLATTGNLNNDIGVPLTLLRLSRKHEIGVVELGMNHPGEIAYLANITKPTIALVNNAQREHLEFMSTVHAVACENGAVLTALPDDGIAIFPSDDKHAEVWQKLAGNRRTITFSMFGKASVYCAKADWLHGSWRVVAETPVGTIKYELCIAGRHNVKNSLAAIACSLAAGIPTTSIVQGLQTFQPVNGRSKAYAIEWSNKEITLVDDTYNANPDSMRAAVDVLAELEGPRLLVLGDMGEVGEHGLQFHAEIGEYARVKTIDQLFTIGHLAQETAKQFPSSRHFESMDALLEAVVPELNQIRSVLVKGSRFMKMEQVIQVVLKSAEAKKEQIHAA
jgi:UDP-N-acetylmuramoyl-tripeptide--D-alanyl-D-alanine ligase